MAETPTAAWINGRFVPWSEAVVPLEDRGLNFAESLYEVFPVTAGRVRLLHQHCARLAAGADQLELTEGVPSPTTVAAVATELMARERVTEGLLYLQLTGGTAPRSHLPLERPQPTCFAYLRQARFPRAEEVVRGVHVVTVIDQRWAHCDLKTTMLLPAVLAKRRAAEQGADEALMVSASGQVYEGASSNLFVVEGGELLFPADSDRLLPGTMRAMVVELAASIGVAARAGRLELDHLRAAREVFITATSRLVLPVVSIDHRPVADGRPGELAPRLAARIRQLWQLD
jgi:D-alanine transaminase